VVTATATGLSHVRALVAAVPDPELPMVSIEDLGILRDVRLHEDGRVEVDITPTYSGCPAMDAIRADIETALRAAGHDDVAVRLVLAPAWTTDWLSLSVRCPQCGSPDTREVSRFGSTACKALWSCRACLEPFDAFKPL
jgi:ring-1,2-phenylacetyl-CoA epoxidase subunit PaaD